MNELRQANEGGQATLFVMIVGPVLMMVLMIGNGAAHLRTIQQVERTASQAARFAFQAALVEPCDRASSTCSQQRIDCSVEVGDGTVPFLDQSLLDDLVVVSPVMDAIIGVSGRGFVGDRSTLVLEVVDENDVVLTGSTGPGKFRVKASLTAQRVPTSQWNRFFGDTITESAYAGRVQRPNDPNFGYCAG